MTVSSIIPVNTFSGNNSATHFDFDFLIENEDELKVTYMNKYGELTELKNGIDYTINKTGSKDGSYIIFPLETSEYKILSEDEKIILELTLPIKQESKFENSGSMAWEAVEWSFDYIVRILQIMDRKIQKSVKIPEVNDYEETSEGLIRLLNETKTKSQKFSEYSEQKAKEAQQSALEAIENADYVKAYADDIKEALNIVKPADENSVGMIKPDNKTTFVQKGGILYSPKRDLYDVIHKDHRLTFEEKEGLELLGEYVYKEGVAGTRYGYPDFYAKCLEEYNSEDNTEEILGYKDMTFQGNLTIKNNIASNFSKDNFVEVPNPREEINSLIIDCIVTMPEEEPSESLHMIYGQKTTNLTSPQVQLASTPKKIQWLLPQKDGTWKNDFIFTTEAVEWGKTYRIVMDYKDGVLKGYYAKEGEELKLAGTQEYPEGISWTEPLCFGKDVNSVYQGKIDLSSIGIEVNNKFFAGTKKAKVNKNGHKYYDIEFKDKIDEIYNSTGTAWYYGVDEANQRILLPKKKYSDTQINQNKYMVVGNLPYKKAIEEYTEVTTSENDTLPLFTGMYFDFKPNHISWLKAGTKSSGTIYKSAYNELVKILKGEETKYGEGFKVIKEQEKVADTDYSEYWIINEDEQTFTAPEKNKELYFKVGNAVENTELIDLGNLTEQLNSKISKTEDVVQYIFPKNFDTQTWTSLTWNTNHIFNFPILLMFNGYSSSANDDIILTVGGKTIVAHDSGYIAITLLVPANCTFIAKGGNSYLGLSYMKIGE